MDRREIAQCFNCNNEFANSDEEIHMARIMLIQALQANITFEAYSQAIRDYMESRGMSEEDIEKQQDRVCNLEVYFE